MNPHINAVHDAAKNLYEVSPDMTLIMRPCSNIAMHSELTVKTARKLTSGVSTANTFWTTVREFAISESVRGLQWSSAKSSC
jgi:hypothetical protein